MAAVCGIGSALSHARRPRSTRAPDNDHYVSYDAGVSAMAGPVCGRAGRIPGEWRVGGRLRRTQDAHRTVERHRVDAGGQPQPAGADDLAGVPVISARDAWAVGQGNGQTLIAAWNGSAWRKQAS